GWRKIFMNAFTSHALLALFTSVLLLNVGCGGKSNKSKNRIHTDPQATESQQSGDTQQRVGTQPQATPGKKVIEENEQPEIVAINGERRFSEDGDDYLYEEDYGRPYETIHKDISYDEPQQQIASGERYGEFGAVMFDDPMWYPGLPDYPA